VFCSRECRIHDKLKRAFVDATETDTVLVMRSLQNTHRAWSNAVAQRVLALEASHEVDALEIFQAAAGSNANRMYEQGELDVGVVSCGQGVGLIHDIPTVRVSYRFLL
jgi:NADH:quinone reductase (non-electrogenic)